MEKKLSSGILILILFTFMSIFLLKSNLDKNLGVLRYNEESRLNQRHVFFAQELGQLFLNNKVLNFYKNYSPFLSKFERNLFSNLDLNMYFFASHPREREGIDEFEKFLVVTLPFFIIGIVSLIYLGSLPVFYYLIIASITSAFISPSYYLGSILFFPFVTSIVAIGILYLLSHLNHLK